MQTHDNSPSPLRGKRFRMHCFQWIPVLALLALPMSLPAPPYAWIPGSSQDLNPRTGNKMAIVDLGTQEVLGQFTIPQVTTGVDPLPVQFSPDGKYAYVVIGGFDPDDPADPEIEDRTSRIFVYDIADVLSKISSNSESIQPLFPATIIPPHSGDQFDGDNTDEPFPTMSPDGSRLYIVSQDEEKLITYQIGKNGDLIFRSIIDTERDPIRLDLNIARTRGVITSYKDQNVTVYDIIETTPTVVATIPVPHTSSGTPLAKGAFGNFPYPSGTDLLASIPPVNDDLYVVFSGGFGPVIPIPPFGVLTYSFALYAVDLNKLTATEYYKYTPSSRNNEVTIPLLMGFETIQAQKPKREDEEGDIIGTLGGTHLLTDFTPESVTRRIVNRPTDFIFLIPFIPKDQRTLFLSSGSDIDFSLTPKYDYCKLYKVDLDAANPQAAETTTIDRITCGVFGQHDEDTLWVAGNDIFALGAFQAVDLQVTDPRDSKIYWVNMSTGAIEKEVTLPFAGGAISVQRPPETSPTPTPSPSPTATQPPIPPGQDNDGDGYDDLYELIMGFDPNDPNSHPSLGDVDGDGDVTVKDAMLLYRWKIGLIDGTGLLEPDINGDGVVDTADAIMLYRWAIGSPMVPIIPLYP